MQEYTARDGTGTHHRCYSECSVCGEHIISEAYFTDGQAVDAKAYPHLETLTDWEWIQVSGQQCRH